jgi:phosphomannomutase
VAGERPVMRHAMHVRKHFERQLVDGIKILFDREAWVLLIPSKEHEILPFSSEAGHREGRKLASEYEEKVVEWRDNA